RKIKKDPTGKLHDSYDGIWKAFGKKTRTIARSAKIHVSTRQRVQKLADYNPANLPAEPNYEA
ncbi:hypothetical protein, partial [Kaarinaea lacus]